MAGTRLLEYLAQRFRYLDRAAWAAEIAAGHVDIDGRPASAASFVRRGAEVTYHKLHQEPFADVAIAVLHDDEALVAVDKPAHLPMHADGPFVQSTLVAVLRASLAAPNLSLVHRLDRETSGVCLLARTEAARRALQGQFAAGTVRKTYHALVRGRIDAPFVVDQPIGRSRHSQIGLRRACGDDATDAQAAHTSFWPEAHGDGVTLVRCEPTTGRTHQIRVHLEANGTPIVGDKLYGRPDADYLAFVARVKANADARVVPAGEVDRQLLHASAITVQHPLLGTDATYRAPLPAMIAAAAPQPFAPPRHGPPGN